MVSANTVKVHAMKADEEYRYSSTHYLTSALYWGRYLTPCAGHFTPRNDPVATTLEAG
jgi:hypothetical protein